MAFFVDGELYSAFGLEAIEGDLCPVSITAGRKAAATARLHPQHHEDILYVAEGMETRKNKRSAHDNLMRLSRMTGAAVALHQGPIQVVSPRRWTSRLSKPEHQNRTLAHLTDKEKEAFDKAVEQKEGDTRSEIIDAIGIGLYILGRTR